MIKLLIWLTIFIIGIPSVALITTQLLIFCCDAAQNLVIRYTGVKHMWKTYITNIKTEGGE